MQQDEGNSAKDCEYHISQVGFNVNLNTILTGVAVSGICYAVTILIGLDRTTAVNSGVLQNMQRVDSELLRYARENRDRIIKLEGKVLNK